MTCLNFILGVVVAMDEDENVVCSGISIVNDGFGPNLRIRQRCSRSPQLTIGDLEITALIGLVAKTPAIVNIAETQYIIGHKYLSL